MIIGLSGKMRSGKTTTANALLAELPTYTRIAFADVLKEEVADIYGFPLDWCYSEMGKQRRLNAHGTTVRELLQMHGQERRQADPGYWVEQMALRMDKSLYSHFIIDDVRYPDEADFVLSRGGVVIRLDPTGSWWQEDEEYGQHESETALDYYDRFTRRLDVCNGCIDVSVARVLYILRNRVD